MVERFRKDLQDLKAAYDSGVMMSLRESISGSIVCGDVLKHFDKINEMAISNLNKIGRIRLYVEGLDQDEIEYGSSICQNINDTIEKYIPHKEKTRKIGKLKN